MLTIYTLLEQYATDGLSHYYQNYDAYKAEITAFKGYLDELLQAETRDGVSLSEEDKQNGIANMIECAKKYESYVGISIPDFAVDFVALRQKMNEVDERLTAPNSMINVSSSNLSALTAILESAKVCASNSEQPALRVVLTADSCQHEFEEGSNVCIKCETECVIDPSGDAGNVPGGDGSEGDNDDPGEGGPSGGTDDKPEGGDPGENPEEDPGEDPEDEPEDEPDDGYNILDYVLYVTTESSLKSTAESAGKGEIICVYSDIAMTEDISVNGFIQLAGTNKLKDDGHVLVLTDKKASIAADGPVNVASGVDGYVPVKASDSDTYTLTEITAAKTGGEIAGSKNEKLGETRYLYLDLDPVSGMTLDELYASMSFRELTDYTVKFSIEGNSGSGLVKTADRLVVTASNAEGRQVAQITFVVIVMGDTNCNGKVNSSDAAVTKNISMGKASTLEARMAADVNFSGTVETPKVNSNDVSHIMSKWFAWDLNKYVSNLK
jgi:hypothetical protein